MGWRELVGWFNFTDLYDEVVDGAADGDTVVEIGSAHGRSLAYLARRVLDSGKRVRVVAVDPWRYGSPWDLPRLDLGDSRPFVGVLAKMIAHAPEELESVTLLRLCSAEAARVFDNGTLRAVFIDGDHSYEGARSDLLVWGAKVKPGGVFAGHDIDLDGSPGRPGGVYQAVNEVLGPEGVGYRVQRNRDSAREDWPGRQWTEGENRMPWWGGPCWRRL